MTAWFTTHTPSYAQEQLTIHLASLATLPVASPISSSLTAAAQTKSRPSSGKAPRVSPHLESALNELSSSKPPSRQQLISILESLTRPPPPSPQPPATPTAVVQFADDAPDVEVDRVVEAEILSRVVSVVWSEVMQSFVQGALRLDEERNWWNASISSRRGVVVYLVQTLPHRLVRAVAQPSSLGTLSIPSIHSIHWPSRTALFKPLHETASAITSLGTMASPLALTRREMLASRQALTYARDNAAYAVGLLAAEGPQFHSHFTTLQTVQTEDLLTETNRVYAVLCQVLDIAPSPPATTRRSRSSAVAPPTPPSASPAALLAVLTTHLPRAHGPIDKALESYGRPSVLTRLWFPFLFIPPALWVSAHAVVRNKEWIKGQVRTARETVSGFFVQWVWEPIESIAKTMRGGGEGLGVAPTTVKVDQESLERMVMDLGRDYYHLQGAALDVLKDKIRRGDMEAVLKVYENELQAPLKNALMGNLIRTLLIQVQKTKTDLSLSLLSLDHLLRSQQLTFAFVGVAPSVLVLYGLWGWLQQLWRGENRGKGRRRRYFSGLRDVERLLLTSPEDDHHMADRDRGLLIVGVSGLRSWAAGIGTARREAFLDDLRMVEDPMLTRGDKLRVVERIWRCWGVDGRGLGV